MKRAILNLTLMAAGQGKSRQVRLMADGPGKFRSGMCMGAGMGLVMGMRLVMVLGVSYPKMISKTINFYRSNNIFSSYLQ